MTLKTLNRIATRIIEEYFFLLVTIAGVLTGIFAIMLLVYLKSVAE